MKNAKKIVGTMVLSAALLGTGYAAWNDTLQVDTIVKTGNFDLQFTEAACDFQNTSNYVNALYHADETTDESFLAAKDYTAISNQNVDGKIENNDVLTLRVYNMYPNSEAQYTAKIKNLGTIPANLSNLEPKSIKINGTEADENEKLLFTCVMTDADSATALVPGAEREVRFTVNMGNASNDYQNSTIEFVYELTGSQVVGIAE